ncbi:unnamed protein product [Timema podura]|uniref:C2HC/C3H-type domain-containing protein n=1 Tax=Timema podura TaxID=61482 RepID=A0ABN7P624_TIMPD|nr:unnamed protein product [Timema podura]
MLSIISHPVCVFQRWHRENEELPVHLRRPEVVRPFTVDQWNQFAWESSQASLVPCENCGRTFAPDRLEVHQRSCKTPLPGVRRKLAFQQPPPSSSTPAPLLATSSLINTCSPTRPPPPNPILLLSNQLIGEGTHLMP